MYNDLSHTTKNKLPKKKNFPFQNIMIKIRLMQIVKHDTPTKKLNLIN